LSLNLSELLADLAQQKEKQHAKVLSESAISLSLQRILDVSDLMAYHIWLSIPPICWSALSPLPLFNLQPYEIEPLMLEFKAEIPHVEFDIPRDLLEKLVSLPPTDAVALLPPDIRNLLSSILAPGMTLEDIMLILRDIYPPTIIPFLPDIVHIDLPNFRAIWQGIYLIITKIDLSETYDWLKDPEKFLKENLKEPYASEMLGSMRLKGVYDETPYDQSYYDPNVWRAFIASTYTKLFVHYGTLASVRKEYESLSTAGEMRLDLLKELYNRFQLVKECYVQNFILGYSLLGVSKLSARAGGGDRIATKIVDYDNRELEVAHYSVDHLQWGFILDISHLDVGFLMPEDTVYKTDTVKLESARGYVHETEGAPPVARLAYDRARKMRRDSVWTPWAFGNYNTPEEMRDPHRSERTSQWHELQTLYALLDTIVDGILEKHDVDVMAVRAYKTAARQLVSWRVKRHRWGMHAYRVMDDEEYRNWWLKHWESQGLKRDILLEIYNTVKPCLNNLQRYRLRLGRLVKHRRHMLANLPLSQP